ncbi:uncharacterized protein LOC62_04G006002 [Vanrija pseudolonga]|uniref:Uncharacterized protein n=1 Tax=Vanrija pseudolonga TaxID=143232 RepID=A0AAF0YAN5_9TREE|nr:hypothetical protein LOC62_04G006002 [Vanrija pseudolonga]
MSSPLSLASPSDPSSGPSSLPSSGMILSETMNDDVDKAIRRWPEGRIRVFNTNDKHIMTIPLAFAVEGHWGTWQKLGDGLEVVLGDEVDSPLLWRNRDDGRLMNVEDEVSAGQYTVLRSLDSAAPVLPSYSTGSTASGRSRGGSDVSGFEVALQGLDPVGPQSAAAGIMLWIPLHRMYDSHEAAFVPEVDPKTGSTSFTFHIFMLPTMNDRNKSLFEAIRKFHGVKLTWPNNAPSPELAKLHYQRALGKRLCFARQVMQAPQTPDKRKHQPSSASPTPRQVRPRPSLDHEL